MILSPSDAAPVCFPLSRRTGRAHGQRPCGGGMEFERGQRRGGYSPGPGRLPAARPSEALPAKRQERCPPAAPGKRNVAERHGLPTLAPCTNRHPGKTGALRTTSPPRGPQGLRAAKPCSWSIAALPVLSARTGAPHPNPLLLPRNPPTSAPITHADVRSARGDIPVGPFRSLDLQGFVRGGDNRKKDTTHGSSRVLHASAA